MSEIKPDPAAYLSDVVIQLGLLACSEDDVRSDDFPFHELGRMVKDLILIMGGEGARAEWEQCGVDIAPCTLHPACVVAREELRNAWTIYSVLGEHAEDES